MNPKDLKRWVKRQDIAQVAVASDASAAGDYRSSDPGDGLGDLATAQGVPPQKRRSIEAHARMTTIAARVRLEVER